MSSRLRPAIALATTATALVSAAALPAAAKADLYPVGAYATVRDAECYLSWQFLFPIWRYTQPVVSFTAPAAGDPNPATRIDASALKDGKTVAAVSLTQPNTSRNLNAGRFGGWTIALTATRRDGSIVRDSLAIPAHPSPDCNVA